MEDWLERLRRLDEAYYEGTLTEAQQEERRVLRRLAQDQALVRTTDRQTDIGNRQKVFVTGDEGMVVPLNRPRRMRFTEAIEVAEDQIGFHEYSRQHAMWGILHDMCRAMAEVYMMSPTARIKVAGEEMEAGMVAEVFREVTQEMAETLAEELRESIAEVKCVKAYLRSALYNKVFEFEACEVRLDEQVKRDMGWM